MQESNNKYVQSLIEASQKGSKNSYLQLCELNLRDIFSLCLLFTADAEESWQITKKVFLTSWNNIKQVREDTSFNAWLHGFAIAFILDDLRENVGKIKVKSLNKSEYWLKARSSKLGKFLLSLNELERVVLILHDYVNYSYKEIKELLWHVSSEDIPEVIRTARRKYFME